MTMLTKTIRVSSSVHTEVLEFEYAADEAVTLESVQAKVVARQCKRVGVEGDATGSDYHGANAPITAFEVLGDGTTGGAPASASADFALAPHAPETQTASVPASQVVELHTSVVPEAQP